MKTKNFLVMLLFMMVTFTTFAFVQDGSTDPGSGTIVEWLTPFIVLAGTWVFRKFAGKIPGWATMIVVSSLSAAVAWVTPLVTNVDASYLEQVLYGLLAVFINQLYRQITGGNTANSEAKSA